MRADEYDLSMLSIFAGFLEDLWPFLDRDEFAQNMIVEPVSC
jgi:hypothetical protein